MKREGWEFARELERSKGSLAEVLQAKWRKKEVKVVKTVAGYCCCRNTREQRMQRKKVMSWGLGCLDRQRLGIYKNATLND